MSKSKGKEVEKIEKKLKECREERDEYLEGWKRAKADFINYKEEEKERLRRIIDYSVEDFILEILPIVDDFERAVENLSEELQEQEEVRGVLQIKRRLEKILRERGVERMEVEGERFDPRVAEAVEEVDVADEDPETVVEVVRTGYKRGDKIIRPAKVKVNKSN